jgi:glycerophosphoryl diester phosphodiesterase
VIISFNHEALRRVKERLPGLATGALYGPGAPVDDPVQLAGQIGANAVMPDWRLLTPAQLSACHAAGLSVNVWGADADYPFLVAMGVDCVNADDPAQARRGLAQGLG